MATLLICMAHFVVGGTAAAIGPDKHLAPYCQLVKARPCNQRQLMDQLNKELLTYKKMKDKRIFQEVERMHQAISKGIQGKVPFEKVMQGFQPKNVPHFLGKSNLVGVSPSEKNPKATGVAKKARKY